MRYGVGEDRVLNSMDGRRNGDIAKLWTRTKCSVTNHFQPLGERYILKFIAAVKTVVLQLLNTRWHHNRGERNAISKATLANRGYATAEGYAR